MDLDKAMLEKLRGKVTARQHADEARRPFADITLRAERDCTTARVHRGVLCSLSRVFKEALLNTPKAEVLPLPGKCRAELDVLIAWMYHLHPFTKDNIASALAMAREYDMPQMMESAETWLVHEAQGGKLMAVPAVSSSATLCAEFVRMLSLVSEFKLRRFATACDAVIDKLSVHQTRQILKMQTAEASQ